MNNAEKFKSQFGLYASELWAMPEKEFLMWLNAEFQPAVPELRYDIYSIQDKRMVKANVSAARAAELTDVSINFVILSARRKARNAFGRVATISGYYFSTSTVKFLIMRLTEALTAVSDALSRRSKMHRVPVKPPTRWRLDAKMLSSRAYLKGYPNIQKLCEACDMSIGEIRYYSRSSGVRELPVKNIDLAKICQELGCRIEDLFVRLPDT